MEEKGKSLNRGLEQAQGERGQQVPRHGIGHAGGYGDMDKVVADGFAQRELVLAHGLNQTCHGIFLSR